MCQDQGLKAYRRSACKCKHERRASRDGRRPAGVVDDVVVAHEWTVLRRGGRAILNTHRDCEGKDGRQNTSQSDPRQPGDLYASFSNLRTRDVKNPNADTFPSV